MRYVAYLLQTDNGYRDLEETFEAESPRAAAQQAFDMLGARDLHPDEQFPQLLVVPDSEVHVFSRDDHGRAVTTDEDLPRMIAKGPKTSTVTFFSEGMEDDDEAP